MRERERSDLLLLLHLHGFSPMPYGMYVHVRLGKGRDQDLSFSWVPQRLLLRRLSQNHFIPTFHVPSPTAYFTASRFFFLEIALILGFASAAFVISRIRDEIPLMLLTLENMRLCITRNPKNYSILRHGIFLQRIIKISHMDCIPKRKINNKKPSILQIFFFFG